MNAISRSVFAVAVLLAIGAGCTAKHYHKSADREAYGIIKSKSGKVRNMDRNFTIEQTNTVFLEKFPLNTNAFDFMGAEGEKERGARRLTLEGALGIAVQSSRAYQSEKERLYGSALRLSLARHVFAPLFSSSGSIDYQGEKVRVDELTDDPNVTSDNLVERQGVGANGKISADWLIRDVGKITTSLTAGFLRYVSGDSGLSTSAQLGATFARPLLQNAGFKSEKEALIQAERTMLYELRKFTQYRKEFSVQIATDYYRVLGNRDSVRNSYLNLQSSGKNAERSRALAQEGRITQSDLGRLEQQELQTEGAWINAVRDYRQALDNFKIRLGLRIDDNIILDDHDLEVLTIDHPTLSVEDSVQVALAARLDLLNQREQFEDAERQVDLAKNRLKPKVDLVASVNVYKDPNDNNGFPLPDPERYDWSAGLNIDPGIDKKAERNSYRTSIITRNQAAREVVQQEDEIRLQIRDSWRTLDQAKRSYEISEIGVRLAERRVEEQNLLAELGRAKALDQVDAQNALIDSKNQRTQALVTHTIARLQFWNNMGILYIKENGQWEEMKNAQGN